VLTSFDKSGLDDNNLSFLETRCSGVSEHPIAFSLRFDIRFCDAQQFGNKISVVEDLAICFAVFTLCSPAFFFRLFFGTSPKTCR
jgi:hypothetical protein